MKTRVIYGLNFAWEPYYWRRSWYRLSHDRKDLIKIPLFQFLMGVAEGICEIWRD